MGRYKHRELKWAGIDYFKAYVDLPDFESSGLYGLSKNSHSKKWDDETIIEYVPEKIKNFGFFYQIRDTTTNQTLAFLGISDGRANGFLVRNSFIEVTGIWLEIRGGPKWFLDFCENLWLRIKGFARVDVTFDMECETDWTCRNIFLKGVSNDSIKHNKSVKDKNARTFTPIVKNKLIETLYLGNKNGKANTYQLLRVYNKKADCKAKWKEWLYERYEKGKEITRFEIEIRRDLAQFWTVDKLLSHDYIFSVINKTWFGWNRQFFSFVKQEDFAPIFEEHTLYRQRLHKIKERKERFDQFGKDFTSDIEEKQCVSTFVSYAKRLKKNGYTRDKINEILEINDVF